MGPELAAISVASLALDAGSSIIKGHGEAAGQEFQAARDRRAAELGRIKADQTDAQYREELNTTLGMIDVIRAAANADPLSPTALAVKSNEQRISDRQRQIAIGNIRAQVAEDEASALYRKSAARYALLGGYVGAAGKVAKAIPSLAGGGGGGRTGSGTSDPRRPFSLY